MIIKKVCSGGQTGSDQAGLDAAIEAGLPHGGWCPKGRRCEDGIIPEKYKLKETGSPNYLVRTKLNVTVADATIVFTFGPAKSGSLRTLQFARELSKPSLHVNLFSFNDDLHVQKIIDWLDAAFGGKAITLNVAGSRESSRPGIGSKVKDIMTKVIERVGVPNDQNG